MSSAEMFTQYSSVIRSFPLNWKVRTFNHFTLQVSHSIKNIKLSFSCFFQANILLESILDCYWLTGFLSCGLCSHIDLTCTTPWANSADDNFIFFLLFQENRIWHFMQIVSIGVNLHEMSKSVFWEKIRKIFQYVVCWNFYPVCKVL